MAKGREDIRLFSFLRKELITLSYPWFISTVRKQGKNVLECLGQAFQSFKERPFYCLKDRLCSCLPLRF